MDTPLDIVLNVCMGLGLSAACGFRVFVPLLVMSIASLSGELTLAEDMQWIGTYPALVAFSVATILEILAYYIPGVDNLLDTIEVPAAAIAGTLATAAVIPEVSPMLRWGFAVIAGGGAAETVQLATTVTRAASTVTTGGLANSLVATVEDGSSIVLSMLALAVPVIAAIVVVFLIFLGVKKAYKRFGRKREDKTEEQTEIS